MRPGARVVDAVRAAVEREPERVALVFHAGTAPPVEVTYGALWRDTAALARGLARLGLDAGAPLVVVARCQPEFVAAFLAAQQLGLVPVPCPPPDPLEPAASVERRAEILHRCGARVLVDCVPPGAGATAARASVGGLRVLDAAALRADGESGRALPERAIPVAYCQFTSGSGGRAKGVLLTHDNLRALIRARAAIYDLSRADVAVSWLPLSHDMGLIGYVLHPLVDGFRAHLLPAATFLARPAAWPALLSAVRGTISSAPNAAYGFCARRVSDAEVARLDLSAWRIAVNGAEPVTREVVEAFTRRFAPAGFRAAAMLPGYGLAENTLTAASRRVGEGPRFDVIAREPLERAGQARPARAAEAARTVASVGMPLPGQAIRIVDPAGQPLGERQVGEIALRGPTVMHGYLPGTEGAAAIDGDGWLRTGDLGYLTDGELFVVGRLRDVIVRAGRKHYPQDLEEAAGTVPGVRPGRAVAFGVPGPERERVVLAVELRDPSAPRDGVASEVASAVAAAVGFAPDEVILLPPRTIPLTTSGKVMRPEARRRYEAGAWGPA